MGHATPWLFGLGVAMVMVGCSPRPRTAWEVRSGRPPIRAIWVTRWDYKAAGDIAAIMHNVREAGFNTVLFQVRGAGTVFYRSRIEPWADELGGRNPGFDPLAVAVHEAHRRGLSLHAWVNIMPGYRGDKPPTNPRQLYLAHPDWFWHDAQGRRQPLGWYCSLNPCLPEVRRYLVSIIHEVATAYAVDGVHMDYIRFPNEHSPAYPSTAHVPDYPRDERTLSLFRRDTSQSPQTDPALWTRWRTDQVTRLVRDIRGMLRSVRPGVVLTAAVGADPERAAQRHFQDARLWLAQGLLDAVFPMNYASTTQGFERNLSTWSAVARRVPVVVGIMFDGRSGELVRSQLAMARRTGGHFSAFAYNALFDRRDTNGRPRSDEKSDARAALRRGIVPYVRRMAYTRTWRRAGV